MGARATYNNRERGFSFFYPEGWDLRESTGVEENYFAVQVLAPAEPDAVICSSFYVSQSPSAGPRLDDVVLALLEGRERLSNYKKHGDLRRRVVRYYVRDISVSYDLPASIHAPRGHVHVMDRIFFLESGAHFYKLAITGPEPEFRALRPDANEFLRSFLIRR
jgi:hypothetical protein